ncbi:hypothetical protein [Stenotrophomonas maltophilia]|uniref:hypothetical protein n=2 Tax=Lysobacteraceae TaxID=32033 RepID=UPI0015DFDF7C|nr:hypothetical protein [Stenotrophomonas maltophilia]
MDTSISWLGLFMAMNGDRLLMSGTWITHHDGFVEERRVIVQTYSDGGYRVKTTQGEDDAGDVFGDDSSTLIIPPSSKGSPIDIDGETIDEVREQLTEEGFSEEAITEIVGYFPG